MMSLAQYLSFLSAVAVVVSQEPDYNRHVSLSIYHAFDGEDYHETGKTTLHNLNPGKINIHLSALGNDINQKLSEHCLEDKFVHIKTVIETTVSKELEFLSFVKTCWIVNSPAILNINIDHSGSIVSTSLSPTVNLGSFDGIDTPTNFDISYIFRQPEIGPMPDTATYINRLDKEREAKERGSTQDNRSFFAKYWMYIVPVVLFVLLSGSANADAPAASGR